MARAAARAGARMVYLSSVAVYGRRTTYDGGPGSVDEDFGLDRPSYPGDFYARSKREAELALWRVADGNRAQGRRPPALRDLRRRGPQLLAARRPARRRAAWPR